VVGVVRCWEMKVCCVFPETPSHTELVCYCMAYRGSLPLRNRLSLGPYSRPRCDVVWEVRDVELEVLYAPPCPLGLFCRGMPAPLGLYSRDTPIRGRGSCLRVIG
jgi:hypothetical protein